MGSCESGRGAGILSAVRRSRPRRPAGSLVWYRWKPAVRCCPPAAAAGARPTRTGSEKLELAPAAKLGCVQVTVPVPPTAGVSHVQPDAGATDWKVVPAGIGKDAVAKRA